jgi:hypothetical protein
MIIITYINNNSSIINTGMMLLHPPVLSAPAQHLEESSLPPVIPSYTTIGGEGNR